MHLEQITSIADLVGFEREAHARFEEDPTLRRAILNWLRYINTRFELTFLLNEQQLRDGLPRQSSQFKEDIKAAFHSYINRIYGLIQRIYRRERT